MVRVLLLGTNVAYKFYVCDIFELIVGDFGFQDKFDGVGTFYASVHPLCKASEFICSRSVPGVFEFRVMEELSVFKGLSGLHINDGVCTVMASGKEVSSNAVIGWVAMCALALGNLDGNAVNVHNGRNVGVI